MTENTQGISHDATSRIANFQSTYSKMIATNETAYKSSDLYSSSLYRATRKDYTIEEVMATIATGTTAEKANMSRSFFQSDGFYKRIVSYFGTLLKNTGILIPSPAPGKTIKDKGVAKRYTDATNFVDRMDLQNNLTRITMKVLIDGAYYGVTTSKGANNYSTLDLPFAYCRTNFKDELGNDIIEFDTKYFDSLILPATRKMALETFPKEMSKHYRRWKANKAVSSWMFVNPKTSICFYLYDTIPLFLNVIPSTMEYDLAIARNAVAEAEEIKKIIVQQIPHIKDGSFLLEPTEAEEIHKGAVKMLQSSNPNVSVLTTYADIDSISSQGKADSAKVNNIEKMKGHIFNEAGVSGQVFAASGNLSVELSLKNDLALMMMLGNKFSRYIKNTVNSYYANGTVTFKYTILPISWYNEDKYLENAMKTAQSGYSLLLPALAQGFTQADLSNIKNLENDLLDLTTILIPPQSAHTQTGAPEDGGRPTKANDEKSDKTVKNETSKDKQGGDKNA